MSPSASRPTNAVLDFLPHSQPSENIVTRIEPDQTTLTLPVCILAYLAYLAYSSTVLYSTVQYLCIDLQEQQK